MRRTLVAEKRAYSEQIAPGVRHERLHPGGKDGPNGEVLLPTPGGQVWSDIIALGSRDDAFQTLVPDIRLPANQMWPLHWHDCWTAIVVLEGQCLIGDWWMSPGDVFITEPSLEYGPLVIGPQGVRLFEIFARAHLSPGGYAPEYRDHPTLQGSNAVFAERSSLNMRNAGRQCLPCDGVPGLIKSRLAPGAQWDLGQHGDPERGILRCVETAPGQRLTPHACKDWRAMIVLDGSLQVAGRGLGTDDYLLLEPRVRTPDCVAGANGARVLEACRAAGGGDD